MYSLVSPVPLPFLGSLSVLTVSLGVPEPNQTVSFTTLEKVICLSFHNHHFDNGVSMVQLQTLGGSSVGLQG